MAFLGEGRPSTPGWKPGQLDKLTDWAVNDQANRPIICEYKPDALWLWFQYRGTVLSLVIIPIVLTMLLGIGIDAFAHEHATISWPLLSRPPAEDNFIQELQAVNKLWEYQLTLASFILTFFTSQAYSYWRSTYFCARAIQGRINDVCMLLTIGAARDRHRPENVSGLACASGYSEEARALVRKCTRLIKTSHVFFWAATPTRANGLLGDDDEEVRAIKARTGDIGPLLLSAEGLAGLVRAGELTAGEVDALLGSGLPPSQYAYVLLEWVGQYALGATQSGALRGGAGLEENLLRQLTGLRAEYFNIGDFAAGRMPLAYVQLVQVLVDSLVVLAPFALYPELGSLTVPATGLLTLFFKGLLELSKSFLDPFGNEGYPGQNIRVDVLVSELNFGAASRWVQAGAMLPGDKDDRQS